MANLSGLTAYSVVAQLDVAEWPTDTAGRMEIFSASSALGDRNIQLRLSEGDVITAFMQHDSGSNTSAATVDRVTAGVSPGNWFVAAAVFNAGSMSAYCDGTLDSTPRGVGTAPVVTPDFDAMTIGKLSGLAATTYGERWFQGSISWVRIFDRALSAAELDTLRIGGDVTSGLIHHWNAEDIVGSSWPDRVGSAHGTIYPLPTEETGDPYWSLVSTLMHFNGSNGAVNIVDSGPLGLTYTPGGSAALTTADSQFGSASFDNGDNGWARTTTQEPFQFEDLDFTVEAFVYRDGTATRAIAAYWHSGALGWYFGQDTSNKLIFYYSTNTSVTLYPASSAVIPASAWTHVAVCRDDDLLRFFIGGVPAGTYTIGSGTVINSPNCPFSVGSDSGTDNQPFLGLIDELRITKGYARYTEAFTPPALPFPGHQGISPYYNPMDFASTSAYFHEPSFDYDGRLYLVYDRPASSNWDTINTTELLPANTKLYFEWERENKPRAGAFAIGFYGTPDADATNLWWDNSDTNIDGVAPGEIGMIAIDTATGEAWVGENGVWLSGDPATGDSPMYTVGTSVYFQVSLYMYYTEADPAVWLAFNEQGFQYAPPTGFRGLGDPEVVADKWDSASTTEGYYLVDNGSLEVPDPVVAPGRTTIAAAHRPTTSTTVATDGLYFEIVVEATGGDLSKINIGFVEETDYDAGGYDTASFGWAGPIYGNDLAQFDSLVPGSIVAGDVLGVCVYNYSGTTEPKVTMSRNGSFTYGSAGSGMFNVTTAAHGDKLVLLASLHEATTPAGYAGTKITLRTKASEFTQTIPTNFKAWDEG